MKRYVSSLLAMKNGDDIGRNLVDRFVSFDDARLVGLPAVTGESWQAQAILKFALSVGICIKASGHAFAAARDSDLLAGILCDDRHRWMVFILRGEAGFYNRVPHHRMENWRLGSVDPDTRRYFTVAKLGESVLDPDHSPYLRERLGHSVSTETPTGVSAMAEGFNCGVSEALSLVNRLKSGELSVDSVIGKLLELRRQMASVAMPGRQSELSEIDHRRYL